MRATSRAPARRRARCCCSGPRTAGCGRSTEGRAMTMTDAAPPASDDGAVPTDLRVLDGRADFEQAVLAALDEAARAGTPQLWFCDPDFAAWPLAQPAVLDALGRWAGSRRRLTLLANDYRPIAERYPRWLNWRRQWSHIVQCLAVHPEDAAGVQTLLYLPER